jgi:hypothetical protein
VELHALGLEPVEHGAGLGVGDLGGAVVERGLRETLLVNAGLEEQFVGDDGVIHAHAAFVEDAHDGLPAAEVVGDFLGERAGLGRHGAAGERFDVRGPVLDGAGLEPGREAAEEEVVGEVGAPEGGVFHAGLGERAVEVEHADKAGGGAGPVGDGEDRGLVRDEAVEDVVRILPDGLGDDDGRLRVDRGEHRHAFLLGGDEAVLEGGLVGMGADELVAELGDSGGELPLHRLLAGPGFFVGGLAQVTVGDEQDGFLRGFFHDRTSC